jgi:hypothetical protein
MSLEHKDAIIKLYKEYVDCFAWNYRERFGLSRELGEHRLPIKSGSMTVVGPDETRVSDLNYFTFNSYSFRVQTTAIFPFRVWLAKA